MKWEHVKNHVGCRVFANITQGGFLNCHSWFSILADLVGSDYEVVRGRSPRDAIELYADKAYERVMDWDIRCVGRLRDLFPDQFPPSLKKGDLVADYDENGDWAVERRPV